MGKQRRTEPTEFVIFSIFSARISIWKVVVSVFTFYKQVWRFARIWRWSRPDLLGYGVFYGVLKDLGAKF